MDTSWQNVMNTTEQSSQNQVSHESDKAALTMGAFGAALIAVLCIISSILHF